MSQNADQNNGMLEESNIVHKNDEVIVEDPENIDSSSSITSIDNISDIKQVTDTTPDISTSSKSDSADQSVYSFISHNSANQVENINKITTESDECVSKLKLEENGNKSRELKLLLALSKEANLETNLSRRRKSLSLKRKPDYRNSPNKGNKIQYPVTAESELEMELSNSEDIKSENKADDGNCSIIATKSAKRKKSSFSDTSGDGAADETTKKTRKPLTTEIIMFKANKDMFCWRCHKDSVNICCETCPRSYHQKCLKQTISDSDHWPCPECVSILKAESTQSRSPALKGMTLEHLCSLLKFAVNRMIQCQGSEPFIHAVNDNEFPDYKKYIIQPMDLTLLEKNIKENFYGSTQAFEADAKWILHNSIVFNSYQSKLTTVARSIIKICKQEMAEIENCPNCYLNANTKKNTWFVEVCPKPHLLVWAKLRGFPYWPGKAMSCKDGMVDVRFFGAHDRAWVPEKECFLYSPKDPNSFRVKRADIAQCVEELCIYVENLKKVFGEFQYPSFKTPLDPNNEIKQIEMFLPQYKSDNFKHKMPRKGSEDSKESNQISDDESKDTLEENAQSSKECIDDEAMEGYGTDDEDMTDLDTEMRKNLMKTTNDKLEADEDDTQVPSNIEPDKCGAYEVVLTKGALKSFSERKNAEQSESNKTSKRLSLDDTISTPSKKIYRRDSDTKSESNRISDKINHLDISENMEVSLGNDDRRSIGYSENISSSSSECSSDFSVELKRKPVQVDVDNAEFTISPVSKLKMADKLIQRLSDADKDASGQSSLVTGQSEKPQNIKRNINNDKLPHTTKLIEKLKEIIQPCEPNLDSDCSSDVGNSVSSSNEPNIDLPDDSIKDGVNNIVNGCTTDKHEDVLLETADDERTMPLLSPKAIEEEITNDKEEDNMTGNDSDGPKSSDENSTDDNTPLSTISQPKLLETSTDFPINKEVVIKRKSILEHNTDKSLDNLDMDSSSSGLNQSMSKKFKSKNIIPISELVRIRLPEKPVKSYTPSKNQKHDVTLHKITVSSKTVNAKTNIEDLSDNLAEQQNNVDISKLEENDDPPKLTKNNNTKVCLQKDSDESDNHEDDSDAPLICDSELPIDKAKIIDIIHSSLNEGSNSPEKSSEKNNDISKDEPLPSKKRKLSSEECSVPKETPMFNSLEESEFSNKSSDKENKTKMENFSLLRKTLHAKKISQRSSIQNSPSGSNRSSLHENISDEVKSEADSENESFTAEELEAKKKYLSALNILEKSKTSEKPRINEIRTRSKTEEKREQFRIIDNITKVIDDVAVNYSATHDTCDVDPTSKKQEESTNSKSDNGEIFVKSFAKITPENTENKTKTPSSVIPIITYNIKHRARKSFPQPNYSKSVARPSTQNSPTKELQTKSTPPILIQYKSDMQKVTAKTTAAQAPITTTITTSASQQTSRPIPPLAPTNGYLILQQPQQENLLLIPPNPNLNYATPLTNQMVSMTPCLVSATNTATLRQLSQPPTIWTSPASIQFKPSLNISTSQCYTTQSDRVPDNTITIATTTMANISNATQSVTDLTQSLNDTLSSATISKKSNGAAESQNESGTADSERSTNTEPEVISETTANDDISINNVTDNISKAIAEIVKRPPPKLKPRPPGVLSQQFSEGLPSSVGPVTAKVNAVAHRMCDYFRGMLIETLDDFGKANNAEATIASLKMEIETLKHRHSIELSEIEKNMYTILKDIKRSIAEEKEKIVEDTRIACEAETLKRIDDAKSKQWCANCLKEAQFYCCWNTSYCDYPCQQKHWPAHMNKCSQNMNQSNQGAIIRPNSQQLILRPANPPPKGSIGRVITKPIQKLYVNRNLAHSKTMRVQTSGNLLRMMETTPGNFQLMTNSLIRTTTTNAKSGNIVTVTSSTLSPSSSVKKNNTTKTTVKIVPQSTTTVMDDNSD